VHLISASQVGATGGVANRQLGQGNHWQRNQVRGVPAKSHSPDPHSSDKNVPLLALRSVAVLGHSKVKRAETARTSQSFVRACVAAPEDGRTPAVPGAREQGEKLAENSTRAGLAQRCGRGTARAPTVPQRQRRDMFIETGHQK